MCFRAGDERSLLPYDLIERIGERSVNGGIRFGFDGILQITVAFGKHAEKPGQKLFLFRTELIRFSQPLDQPLHSLCIDPGIGSSAGIVRLLVFHHVGPETLSLKRVCGEIYLSATMFPVEGVEINIHAAYEQSSEAFDHLLPSGAPLPQRCKPRHLRLSCALLGEADKNRLRTHFEHDLRLVRHERRDSRSEPYRSSDLVDPILGGRDLFGGGLAGDGGDQGNPRPGESDFGAYFAELCEHRFHQGRVECMGNLEPMRPHAFAFEFLRHRLDRISFPRDHYLPRAVHGGDGNLVFQSDERRLHPLEVGTEGYHSTAPRQGLHQLAARRDELQAVLEAEYTRHASGNELTDAVTQSPCRSYPPGLPHLRESVFNGEERRLRVAGLIQEIGVIRSVKQLDERPVQVGTEYLAAFIDRAAEHGLGLVEITPHSRVLRTLAGEQERHFSGGFAGQVVPVCAGNILSGAQLRQSFNRDHGRRHRECQAMVEP